MIRRLTVIAVAAHALACAEPPPEAEGGPATTAAEADGVFGQAPPAVGGIPSVLMLSPTAEDALTSGEAAGAAPGSDPEPAIDQLGLAFSPTVLLVRVGQTVTFSNSESLAHNVNLRHIGTGMVVFDADTDPAESIRYTFEEPGGYDVSCNVHPGMTAFVFASPTPYATIADQDGAFSFTEVPPGSYTFTVWSTDASLTSERSVEVEMGRTVLDPGAGG